MFSPRKTRLATGLCLALALSAAPASAKPRYLDQVRVTLISRAASCTACHAAPDGKSLNAYGERIAAQPKNLPMADRIARLEREKDDPTSADRDVDQDGVPNWVEILAHKNPADGKEKPDATTVKKITSVVSCHICHRETGLPGEGLKANPHNALGELLAKTAGQSKGPSKPKPKPKPNPANDHARREAGERTPILTRLVMIRTKKPKGSPATYWQKLRLLHAPADGDDHATADEVKEFKKEVTVRKREKKTPPTLGLDCPAHGLDGFLLDAQGLE